jgi:hypothetical protein
MTEKEHICVQKGTRLNKSDTSIGISSSTPIGISSSKDAFCVNRNKFDTPIWNKFVTFFANWNKFVKFSFPFGISSSLFLPLVTPSPNQKFHKVQCSAVQCSAVQCSAVQCSAVQCSAVPHGFVRVFNALLHIRK